MKKNVFDMVVALVNGQPVDMDKLREEVNAEAAHLAEKKAANQSVYDTAREVALSVLSDKPMTAKELFTAGGDQWPEGFTSNKVQYALLHYWNDEIVKHDNGRSAFTYSKKS